MSQMSRVDDVEKPDDIKRLIHNYSRRLQKRKEQESLQGIAKDPTIALEIEDLERKIEELQAKLRDLEKKNSLERSYQTGSEQKSLQAIARILEAEIPATFGEVSIQFVRMLQCCSVARYLDRDIVILLVGDSTFWDRLDETSLLVNFEGRVRIRRDVRSMLTDSLYRVDKEKHIELHTVVSPKDSRKHIKNHINCGHSTV